MRLKHYIICILSFSLICMVNWFKPELEYCLLPFSGFWKSKGAPKPWYPKIIKKISPKCKGGPWRNKSRIQKDRSWWHHFVWKSSPASSNEWQTSSTLSLCERRERERRCFRKQSFGFSPGWRYTILWFLQLLRSSSTVYEIVTTNPQEYYHKDGTTLRRSDRLGGKHIAGVGAPSKRKFERKRLF